MNDTDNANPISYTVALDVLSVCNGEPWVVCGELAEKGSDSIEIHKELGASINSTNVVRLLTMGSDAKATSNIFGRGATFFSSQQLLKALLDEIEGNEAILIKGSRALKKENVVTTLVTGNKG